VFFGTSENAIRIAPDGSDGPVRAIIAAAREASVKLGAAHRRQVVARLENLLKHGPAPTRGSGVDGAPRDDRGVADDAAAAAARQRAAGTPFFWRVAAGVMYAEMPMSRAIRPPLLSEWESDRVQRFRNRERRSRWLAGRALAKVLVKERLGLQGIVEIREGSDGEPLVYEAGFPRPDVWLGISVRHGRVSCVLADRPVSLEVRCLKGSEAELVDSFTGRTEQRSLRRLLGSATAARSAAWAIKEAAQRAARSTDGVELRDVQIDPSLGVQVGDAAELDVLALRYVDEIAVAVVGRFLLEERRTVRIVLDEPPQREAQTPRLQAAIERSMARARRIADARLRWQQLRTEG
jgi:phosphopantetheinyl transferase